MTKDELLNIPVVEKEKKVKKEVSDDAFLSTFVNSEKKVEEVTSNVEIVPEVPKVVDADGDFLIDEDPGLFAEEIKEESEDLKENVVKESKVDIVEEVKVENTVETKVEVVNEDAKINTVVQAAEEKVFTNSSENGKNIELADNIVKESKIEENKNLPADIKPYLEMVKEKLKAFGKATFNVLEMIGDFVENLFKKKN